MFNLLIVDDEPLVQAGIKSMINWETYDVNIIGTATNGAAAWELIREFSPEIVITDIKMPVMSGLELTRKCYEEEMLLPVFIILTSYEEFQFVKGSPHLPGNRLSCQAGTDAGNFDRCTQTCHSEGDGTADLHTDK